MLSERWSQYYDAEKKELNLSNQGITNKDIPDLCKFLNEHPEIKSLNLSENNIGFEGVNLSENTIGVEGAKAFAQNTTIISLNLSENNTDDEGFKALAQNTTLTSLNVSSCGIGLEDAKALAQNKTLTSLNISNNNIGDEGAKALAQNTTLTWLDASNNNIGEEGAKALTETNPVKRYNYGLEVGIKGNFPSLLRQCLFAIQKAKGNPLLQKVNLPKELEKAIVEPKV